VKMQLKAIVIVFLLCTLQITGCGGDSSTNAGVIVSTPAATSTPAEVSEQTSTPVTTVTPSVQTAATATATSLPENINSTVPDSTSPGSTTTQTSSGSIPVPAGYNMLDTGISNGNFLNLYEKYGYDAISKLNQADGKLGIDSFYAATGSRTDFETAFDKQALSLLLGGKVSDTIYTINGVELSGGTNYGGTMLHNAWSAFTSSGDYDRGIDISKLNTGTGNSNLYEWSPLYFKFFNMSGSLNINITGLKTGTGGGDIKAYFIYK